MLAAAALDEEILAAVTLNARAMSSGAPLLRKGGRLLLRASDLDAWRIVVPADAAKEVSDGVGFVDLATVPELVARFDERKQQLDLEIPLARIRPVEIDYGTRPLPLAQPPAKAGAFLGYGLSGYRTGGETGYSALVGAGVFGRLGVLTSDTLVSGSETYGSSVVRLDTAWRYDLPRKMLTLVAGDSLSPPVGPWGRPLRFGGVRVGTNFGTQPGYPVNPLQTIAGTAAVPSVVDILVNGQPIGQRRVPAGNFSINDVPYVTGGGTVQAIVRDPLGREQVYSQTYYLSNRLLAEGLNDWGAEIGALRYGYGQTSWDYRDFLGGGYWRRGLTNRITGEARAQVTGDVRLVGGAVDASLFERVNGTLTAGVSSSNAGSGAVYGVGVQRYVQRGPSFSLQYYGANDGFRQPGDPADQLAFRDFVSGTVGLPLGRYGSLAATYARNTFQGNRPEYSLGTVSYYLTLARDLFLAMNVSHGLSGTTGTTATVSLVIPFGDRQTIASVGGVWNSEAKTAGARSFETQASLTRNLPVGDGWGYRLAARAGGDFQALGTVQNDYAQLQAEAGSWFGQEYGRLTLNGGAVWLDGRGELARDTSQSFVLVDVGGVPDAPVYVNGQFYGRTRSDGMLVVPRLSAYMPNEISIRAKDFPLSYSLGETSYTVTPYYRSGSVVRFDVQRVREASVRLLGPDGEPLRTGTQVRVNGTADAWVGLEGEVFLRKLGARNTLVAQVGGAPCTYELEFPERPEEIIPDLGRLSCKR